MHRNPRGIGLAAVVSVALLVGQAFAASLPEGTKRLSAGAVSGLYSGMTYLFEDGKRSSMYFDPGGEIRVVEHGARPGYGIGTWSIRKNGDVCFTANFKYIVDSKVRRQRNYKYCSSHAVTADGTVISTATDGRWYIRDSHGKGFDEWVKGDVRKKEFEAMKAKFGD